MQLLSNALFPMFLEAIGAVRLPNARFGPVTIAELGSSTVQSCREQVGTALRQLRSRYRREVGQEPEFQVFFQDPPSTDINLLIKLLNSALPAPLEEPESVDYFAAVVPGSIYGRLFPHAALQFAFTTFALNSLSRVPEAVQDRSSPAYNGGRTGLLRAGAATLEAYAAQAREDLVSFLSARADEMADDGVLCLNFRCRDSDASASYSTPDEAVGDGIWDDFVEKGIISASKRDSYNPLHYWRSPQEVDQVLGEFASEFRVQEERVHEADIPAGSFAAFGPSSETIATHPKGLPAVCRGLSSARLRAHFGKEVTNLYLERYQQILSERAADLARPYRQSITWLIVVLVRIPRGSG